MSLPLYVGSSDITVETANKQTFRNVRTERLVALKGLLFFTIIVEQPFDSRMES